MVIGYARVSTLDQSLDLQLDALKQARCERIYEEKASGAKDDRPELQKVLDTLRSGDTFVVYKIDRLARSTKKLIEVYETLEKIGVEFISLQDHLDTTTPTGRAMFKMLGVISELEREMIVERTRAGLQSARSRGRVGGRPKTNATDLDTAIQLYKSNTMSLEEIRKRTGVTKSVLYREIEKQKKSV